MEIIPLEERVSLAFVERDREIERERDRAREIDRERER